MLRRHPRGTDRTQFAKRRFHIGPMERDSRCADQDVGSCAADLLPSAAARVRVQIGPVKRAIPQEDDGCILGHDRRDRCEQGLAGRLRGPPFQCGDERPAARQAAPVADHAHHQGQAAPPCHPAVHHQLERVRGQHRQQFLGDGHKPAINSLPVVFAPAAKAIPKTFLSGVVAGRMIGDGREVGGFAAGPTTDQRRQGIPMVFAMAGRMQVIPLHDRLLYGTIPAIRVARDGSS